MTALTILERCRSGPRDIIRIQKRIDLRMSMETSTGARGITGMPGGGGNSDHMLDYLVDLEGIQEELKARRREHCVEVVAGLKLISMMPDTYGQVLTGYYIRGLLIREIAEEMQRSVSRVKCLKNDAVALAAAIQITRPMAGRILPHWYIITSDD